MKLLKNTTKNDVSIAFKGTRFTIKSNGSLLVQDEVATFWKGVHGFIDVSDINESIIIDAPVKVEDIIQEIQEPTQTETFDELIEEPAEVKKSSEKK